MDILLIHGFGESKIVWSHFIPLLDPKHRYFCPDFSTSKACFSIEEYAEWLHKYCEKEKLSNVVLIGHSMGGYIALEFCAKYPEMAVGLGLFHSSASADSDEKKENRDKTIQFLIKHDTNLFIKHFYPNMFNEDFQKKNTELIEANIQLFSKIPNEALLAATLAMKSRKSHEETLKQLPYPVFQIIGTLDTFVNYKDALNQSLLLQHPHILALPNVSHAGMYESPQVCAEFINNYLASI
jgi:pimeloyl-ACP methyl ester carboxylesterase